MRRFLDIFLVIVLAILAEAGFSSERGLMRNPDIGFGKIVFTLEDDLWIVSDHGGTAVRLTTHPGAEEYAKFSPDGKWIAFTGGYDGGRDVYVMPSEGGEPKRLTFHPKPDEVVEWLPDGTSVLFASNRTVLRNAYSVPMAGGPDEPFPADRIRFASFSPDGKRLAFNRSDSDRMHWNGYKGGNQQDIWIEDLPSVTFKKITDYPGCDNHPMWHRSAIYFSSDREDGRMNVYALNPDDGSIRRKTFFKDWDVESPSLGQDKIVFSCQGNLWVYDIPKNAAQKITMDIPSDRWLTRKGFVDPSEYVQEITLSQDGKTALVQARGDVYLLAEKDALNVTRSYSNEIFPAMSPDGQWIAFFSDRSGEYTLYIVRPNADGGWIRLTEDLKTKPYHPVWSPNSRMLLFGDKDYRLRWVDIGQRRLTEIDRCLFQRDNEIHWEVSDYDWSPDSKWVVYSKCEPNMNNAIYLHRIETGKTFRITDDRYDNTSPAFDKNGKYLYFLSLRNFEPLLDPFMDNHINGRMSQVLAFQLKAGEKVPFREDVDEKKDMKPTAEKPGPSIDLENLADRLFAVPLQAGTYTSLKGGKDGFFYLSREQFGFPDWNTFVRSKWNALSSLHRYRVDNRRDIEVIHGIGDYNPSGDGSKVAYLSGAFSGVIEPVGEAVKGDGSLDWRGLKQEVDYLREYRVIFMDVWRQIRDFFFDPNLHGKDWGAIRGKYEPLIPHVGSRSDLNDLIGKMIGELGVSHEYILDDGDPGRKSSDVKIGVGLLGADMEPDRKSGCWRFRHIVRGANWSRRLRNPLEAPDARIQQGDYLLAIDGVSIRTDRNVLECLVDKAGKKVSLTVGSKPDTAGSRIVWVETLRDETAVRRFEWKEDNYRNVRTLSNDRIGYMHLSDMDETGIQEFEQGFRAERFRDGLIVDVRNNTGGFASWFLIDKLERKMTFFTQTRDFKPMRYPHGVHPGPTVFLCNEGTSSDGEVFLQQVQVRGLGTVVGSVTWGGLVGYNNVIPLLDGGIVTQSNVGFFDFNRRWIVENKGVHPDVVVENRPEDILAGRDPQLEKAVEICLGLLRQQDVRVPEPPPFPKE